MLLIAPSSRMFCSLSFCWTRDAETAPTTHTPKSAPTTEANAIDSGVSDAE